MTTATEYLPVDAGCEPLDIDPHERSTAACAVPACPTAARTLRIFAARIVRHWRLPEDVCDAVALVVSELATNAQLHSGGTEINLSLRLGGAALAIAVGDDGRWRAPAAGAPADRTAECGRGLDIVHSCATRSLIHHRDQGTTVWAWFDLAAGGPALPDA